MALIMNASCEVQTFRVFGNTFTMKPGQIKQFQENMAHFIAVDRRDLGMVALPEELEDIDYRASEEGKKIIEEKRKEGVENRVRKLRELIFNEQVSLKQDLDQANVKADPRIFASKGMIGHYEELAKYQISKDDDEQRKVEHIKELESKIGK